MSEDTEELKTDADGQAAQDNSRIAELEQVIAAKEAEIASLKESGQGMEKRLASLNASLSEAVTSYKNAVSQANPEIVSELISGESIPAIDESLEKAKALVGKVRQGVEREISLTRVPAGAPERAAADLSGMSAREKIQYAMGKK